MRFALLLVLLVGCQAPGLYVQGQGAPALPVYLQREEARFLRTHPGTRPPTCALVCVVVPDYVALDAFGRAEGVDASWMEGYYNPATNRAVFVRTSSPRAVSHELGHLLSYNTGLQSRWRSYPSEYTERIAIDFALDAPRSFGDNTCSGPMAPGDQQCHVFTATRSKAR
jgi:hypothetical protein